MSWPTETDFINGYRWIMDEDGDLVRESALRREPQDGWLFMIVLSSNCDIGVFGILDGEPHQLPKFERDKLIMDWPEWAKRAATLRDGFTVDDPELVEDWNVNYAERWQAVSGRS